MSAPGLRRLIPLAMQDLAEWPSPDSSVLDEKLRTPYEKRRRAVSMYVIGRPFDEIRKESGLGEDEVQRLVKRCLILHADGSIHGFRALIPNYRVRQYTRQSAVSGNLDGTGYVGALEQLFQKLPQIRDLVHQLFYGTKKGNVLPEIAKPISVIHSRFKKELRLLGYTDNDWPFNTRHCGYQALWSYCRSLRNNDAQNAAYDRSGIEASRRGHVGKGIPPLLPNIRPFSHVQLDFHKVDAASIIVLRNDHGVELEIPVQRWHVGLLVDEYTGAILGAHVALEKTPSADSVLEILDNALRPEDFGSADPRRGLTQQANVLLRQLIPELKYQCFASLKVDNAWGNAANEVVNNLMDTVGCAVNFGPVRAWWRRRLIEQIFQSLTQHGLQRLPSTFGAGPGDDRITSPNKSAIKFRIFLSDLIKVVFTCIQKHNIEPNEGLEWASPVQCNEAALKNPCSGHMHQPLPKITQQGLWLTMHAEEVTVRGNINRNDRPYFVSDRCRYTNDVLAQSFWLLGKTLVIYVDRRHCRIVYATVKETGMRLGLMIPEARWRNSDCSWRDRKLFNRSGLSKRHTDIFEDPAELLAQEKITALLNRPKSRKAKSSSVALSLAKLNRVAPSTNSPSNLDQKPTPQKAEVEQNRKQVGDPFGLMSVPPIKSVRRTDR